MKEPSFTASAFGVRITPIRLGMVSNAVAIILVAILSWRAMETANALQRGENTIALLNGYTAGEVHRAQAAILSFVEMQNNEATRIEVDWFEQKKRFTEDFFPYVRHTEVVATCMANQLCLEEVILSHSCKSISGIFHELDRHLPDLDPIPSRVRGKTFGLIQECMRYIRDNPEPY